MNSLKVRLDKVRIDIEKSNPLKVRLDKVRIDAEKRNLVKVRRTLNARVMYFENY
jgi:uncharacterized membrane protein